MGFLYEVFFPSVLHQSTGSLKHLTKQQSSIGHFGFVSSLNVVKLFYIVCINIRKLLPSDFEDKSATHLLQVNLPQYLLVSQTAGLYYAYKNLRDEPFFLFNIIFCTLSKQLMCQPKHMRSLLAYGGHPEVFRMSISNGHKMRKTLLYAGLRRLLSRYNTYPQKYEDSGLHSPNLQKSDLLEKEYVITACINK